MVKGFIILIGLLLIGNAVSDGLSLPVPGSVIGMVLLFLGLLIVKGVPEDLGKVSDGLISQIGLLFVPAGAGISLYLGMIAENWLVIILASVGSTVLTLIFTAMMFRILSKGDAK